MTTQTPDRSLSPATRSSPDEPARLRRLTDTYFGDRLRDHHGGHILKGAVPGASDIALCSNDYLALAEHPEIIAAHRHALDSSDHALFMSGVYLHGDHPQRRFEQGFAELLGTQESLLCQSGYSANVGLIQAVTPPDTPLYADMFAHMSIWEGARSAGARPVAFRHNAPDHLDKQIRKHGPGVIAIDSVYSTSGSIAPLHDIVDVARQHDCVLIVDESHAVGTHGADGQGLVAALGLTEHVHFITASLAKAFVARAGVIACSSRLAEFVKYNAMPAIFSSALLSRELPGLEATLRIVREGRSRRAALHANTQYLKQGLEDVGYDLSMSQAQIIPLVAGPESRTIRLRDALESRGVFGSVFCAPATPANRSLVRLTVHSALTREALDRIITACSDIRDEVELDAWPTQRGRRHAPRPQPASRTDSLSSLER